MRQGEKIMLTVEELQVYLAASRAQRRALWRLFERRKRGKQRLLECETKARERPGLDAVLAGTDEEAEELMSWFRL